MIAVRFGPGSDVMVTAQTGSGKTAAFLATWCQERRRVQIGQSILLVGNYLVIGHKQHI